MKSMAVFIIIVSIVNGINMMKMRLGIIFPVSLYRLSFTLLI